MRPEAHMKAVAVNPTSRQVRVIDHPEPSIQGPTQVKVRPLEVGVCGTDREIVGFHYGTPPEGSDWLVIGHECLARVEAVGARVRGLSPGDLVVPTVRRPCAHEDCVACRSGRPDFCYSGDYTERGIKGRHGYMTERAVIDARYLNPVPERLRPVGVLVEPLTIAEKALAQVRTVQMRLPWDCHHPAMQAREEAGGGGERCHTALIIGAGPVGLLGGMALAAADFRTFVYSKESADSPRASLAKAFGATYLCADDHAVESLPRLIGSVDVVYEAAGVPKVAFAIMEVLGTNGVFVFTGVPGGEAEASIPTGTLMRKLVLENQVVMGTVNASSDAFKAAIRDLAVFHTRWPEALAGVITGRHDPEGAPEVLTGARTGIKDVISFERP
jgi:threonine dehydrogenase-like Zn-dependent dehydrogenase